MNIPTIIQVSTYITGEHSVSLKIVTFLEIFFLHNLKSLHNKMYEKIILFLILTFLKKNFHF